MFSKKESGNKKFVKGFTLVEIIVVLVILAILAAATIPSLLGFIDDAKFKTIDNEARVVRNAAQAYATEQSAKGETDADIEGKINGVINSNHALHNLLQNDANGTVFETKVESGKIRKFKYTKEIIDTNEDIITDKIRYAVFDDEKTSLLHATSSVTTIDAETFKANIIAEVTAALKSDDPESLKSTLTSSLTTNLNSSLESSMASFETDLTTNLNSSLESGMNSKIAALKTNFRTELGSNVVDLVYPVGSYYVSHNSASPATLFSGTTWTKVVNEFLYCVDPDDSNVTPGTTGGSSSHTHTTGSHTLTTSEIPSHNHSFTGTEAKGNLSLRSIGSADNWSPYWSATGVFKADGRESSTGVGSASSTISTAPYKIAFSMTPSGSIGNTGSGSAHSHGNTGSSSNMPPYMRVYCWRRTA